MLQLHLKQNQFWLSTQHVLTLSRKIYRVIHLVVHLRSLGVPLSREFGRKGWASRTSKSKSAQPRCTTWWITLYCPYMNRYCVSTSASTLSPRPKSWSARERRRGLHCFCSWRSPSRCCCCCRCRWGWRRAPWRSASFSSSFSAASDSWNIIHWGSDFKCYLHIFIYTRLYIRSEKNFCRLEIMSCVLV